jgi:hypothetical protein
VRGAAIACVIAFDGVERHQDVLGGPEAI